MFGENGPGGSDVANDARLRVVELDEARVERKRAHLDEIWRFQERFVANASDVSKLRVVVPELADVAGELLDRMDEAGAMLRDAWGITDNEWGQYVQERSASDGQGA